MNPACRKNPTAKNGTDTHPHSDLEEKLDYKFSNSAHLKEALTHPSVRVTEPQARVYERLEFLGDAVLGLYFASALFCENDTATEGQMTIARDRLRCGKNLTAVGRALELEKYLRIDHAPTDSAYENALEAIFGAIFIDGGFSSACTVAKHIFPTLKIEK